jgi:membrane-anchored protein YejM (alkaline phosphatase superfamily)
VQQPGKDEMNDALQLLLPVMLIAVAGVLVLGLWNMMRGGNPSRSQRLMRWRVILQFIAIVIAMAAIYFARG